MTFWIRFGIAFLIAGTASFYHEMWRDEAHTILLLQSYTTLADFYNKSAHNGHPVLYYFLLLPFQFIGGVFALKLLHTLMAAIGIVAFSSILNMRGITYLLLATSFWLVYGYGAFFRSYVFLLAAIPLSVLCYKSCSYRALNFLLFFASQLHLFGIFFVVFFTLTDYFTRSLISNRSRLLLIAACLLGLAQVIDTVASPSWGVVGSEFFSLFMWAFVPTSHHLTYFNPLYALIIGTAVIVTLRNEQARIFILI